MGSTTASRRLAILEDLYLQRDKLNDALTVHPWPQESACGLAGRVERGGCKPKTKRIPESVVRLLVPKALYYIENQARRLLDAREAAEAIVTRGIKTRESLSNYRTKAAREMGLSYQ